jgi:hypothetical protein
MNSTAGWVIGLGIVHHQLRIAEIVGVGRFHFEALWIHGSAKIAVFALGPCRDNINRIHFLAAAEINHNPFDHLRFGLQGTAITMNRCQRTICRVGKCGITDPLRSPIRRG